MGKAKIITSKETGAMGGKAIFRKKGKKYMSKIGKKGAEVRWKSKPKAKK
jgi:hypothetical protein